MRKLTTTIIENKTENGILNLVSEGMSTSSIIWFELCLSFFSLSRLNLLKL